MVNDQNEEMDLLNPKESEEEKVDLEPETSLPASQVNEKTASDIETDNLPEDSELNEEELIEKEKVPLENESIPTPANTAEESGSDEEEIPQSEESLPEEPVAEDTDLEDSPVSDDYEDDLNESVADQSNPPQPKTADEEMMNLLDEHFSKFSPGKIVEGTVVNVDERSVLVDIGFKSESAIPIREFSSTSLPEIGIRIKVYIDSVEDGSGRLKLSKKKADFYTSLERLIQVRDNNETVKGILRRRVKGGMIVEIDNLEAFLPGSQISTKPIPNLDQFIGKESSFKILKIDEERRNIIVSRKKVMMEEQEEKLKDLRDRIVENAELDGEVRNITDYGAFIDLGGIDGLLHITDMSWGHINHPSDMLNIGDKVKVKILNYDEENGKVSLGIKQLVPHPWENIEVKYPEGTIVSGKVVNITNYGAFVELESGVEGLVHVSEMSWTKKVKHPKQILKVGDSVKAIVLATSKEDKRISLGMKQMEPNPWLTIEERYPVDSVIEGSVKTITPFGVFVEIEEDIEGLIHISDISWTKRIYHPKEVFHKGQKVEVKVLSIDKTLHRIALGVKQLSTDPWENLDEKLPINTEIKARIAKIISKGILVDVPVDDYTVEGFAPLSHLGIPGLKKAELAFEVGEIIPVKIIELDLENRRLILSIKAFFFAKDGSEFQAFLDSHPLKSPPRKEAERIKKEDDEPQAASDVKTETDTTLETSQPDSETEQQETESEMAETTTSESVEVEPEPENPDEELTTSEPEEEIKE